MPTPNPVAQPVARHYGSGGIAETNSPFTPPDVGTVVFWMRSSGTPVGTDRLFGTGGDWEVRQMSDGTVVFDLCGEGGTTFATTTPLDEVVAHGVCHVASGGCFASAVESALDEASAPDLARLAVRLHLARSSSWTNRAMAFADFVDSLPVRSPRDADSAYPRSALTMRSEA